jgi:hypothetical protein
MLKHLLSQYYIPQNPTQTQILKKKNHLNHKSLKNSLQSNCEDTQIMIVTLNFKKNLCNQLDTAAPTK